MEEDIINLINVLNTGMCKFQGNIRLDDCGYQEALENLLTRYKELEEDNKKIKLKNRLIKQESNAYAENMIRLNEELNSEKEKSKYEWIRQNCLPMQLVNKLYIPKSLIKEKIEELKEKGIIKNRTFANCGDYIYQDKIEILQELLEEE